MRVALLQTMYDEHPNVLHNIRIVRSVYKDSIFFVTHSFDGESFTLDEIKAQSSYKALPNLGGTIERLRLPANAVSRNYADLFSRLYFSGEKVDLIIALMGDTKIIDPTSFGRRYSEMLLHKYKLYVCQAKGQYFWSKDKVLNRLQDESVVDFMPQLFFVDGTFAFESKVFSEIPVVNEYTTEQCLGDAFLRVADIHSVGRLNKEPTYWLNYTDGVVWQVMTNGAPGRP